MDNGYMSNVVRQSEKLRDVLYDIRGPVNARAAAMEAAGERILKLLLAEGLPVKQAAKLASAISGAAKNMLYQRALALRA